MVSMLDRGSRFPLAAPHVGDASPPEGMRLGARKDHTVTGLAAPAGCGSRPWPGLQPVPTGAEAAANRRVGGRLEYNELYWEHVTATSSNEGHRIRTCGTLSAELEGTRRRDGAIRRGHESTSAA